MHNQPNANDSDCNPTYKVQELMKMLERRCNKSFVQFYALSLDATFIKSFGRIKFKVRIITKTVRYSIKACAIADAKIAYVLKVLFYTGKCTYYQDPDSEVVKNTIDVVKQLCKPYENSYRYVCVDRFYASYGFLEELDKMNLHCTGTSMKNRLPNELRMKKKSQEFKDMIRGDWKSHAYDHVPRADGLSKKIWISSMEG